MSDQQTQDPRGTLYVLPQSLPEPRSQSHLVQLYSRVLPSHLRLPFRYRYMSHRHRHRRQTHRYLGLPILAATIEFGCSNWRVCVILTALLVARDRVTRLKTTEVAVRRHHVLYEYHVSMIITTIIMQLLDVFSMIVRAHNWLTVSPHS